jgi:hypothetical protein
MQTNSFTWSGLNEGFVVAIRIEAKQGFGLRRTSC